MAHSGSDFPSEQKRQIPIDAEMGVTNYDSSGDSGGAPKETGAEGQGEFSVLWTADGSPSLRGATESMHHSGGAYSETQYIYGEGLRQLLPFEDLSEWSVLVVGLGLGYIELLAMAEAIKNKKQLHLVSYESNAYLTESFLRWLRGDSESGVERDVDAGVYDRLFAFFSRDYPGLPIKETLTQLYEGGEWQVKGALDKTSLPLRPYHVLLFDAFSGKTSPELWSEEFLDQFLSISTATAGPTVFSTYACTGVLRRCLERKGYKVEKRPGFAGKRHSTLAFSLPPG